MTDGRYLKNSEKHNICITVYDFDEILHDIYPELNGCLKDQM